MNPNRLYDGSQVSFQHCSCIKRLVSSVEFATPPQIERYQRSGRLYRKQQNKTPRLQLLKNLKQPLSHCSQNLMNQGEYWGELPSKQSQYAHGGLPSAADFGLQSKSLAQSPSESALSKSYLPQQDLAIKVTDAWQTKQQAQGRHIYGSLQKQDGLILVHEGKVLPVSPGKWNSTFSSTTIFDTRKHTELTSKEEESAQDLDYLDRIKQESINDFSRVRQVETVISTDSLSVSFVDGTYQNPGKGYQGTQNEELQFFFFK